MADAGLNGVAQVPREAAPRDRGPEILDLNQRRYLIVGGEYEMGLSITAADDRLDARTATTVLHL